MLKRFSRRFLQLLGNSDNTFRNKASKVFIGMPNGKDEQSMSKLVELCEAFSQS
jgi:hypothetical protein